MSPSTIHGYRNISHRNRDRFQSWVCSSTSLHFQPILPHHFLKSSHLPPSSPWWQPVLHAQRILACRVAKLVPLFEIFLLLSLWTPLPLKLCSLLRWFRCRGTHQNPRTTNKIRRNLWLLCGHFWPSFTLDQPRNSNALRRVTNSVQLCTYVLLQPSIIDTCACYIFTWFHLSVHVCAQIQTLDQSSFLLLWKYSQNELGCLYCMLPQASHMVPKCPKIPYETMVFWGLFYIRGKGFTTKFGCKTHQRFVVLRTETNGLQGAATKTTQAHGGTWVCRKIENPKIHRPITINLCSSSFSLLELPFFGIYPIQTPTWI